MAYIEGRVQSASSGGGIGYAFIKDNFNNTGSCDAYGLFYSYYAYFPGYQVTASAAFFDAKTQEISQVEWDNKFMTIRLSPTPPPPTCFTGDTEVVMADGSSRRICKVRVGERVLGPRGTTRRVVAVETPELGARELFSFNGCTPFVTSEHPFGTPDGWKAVDPLATARENATLAVTPLRAGDRLIARFGTEAPIVAGNLAVALEPEGGVGIVTLTSIIGVLADPRMTLYNLVLEHGHEYFANGFLVHNKGGGW